MAKKRTSAEDNGVATEERRPRQGHLPEMEPPSIPELDDVIEEYVKLRDKRMRVEGPEREKKQELHDLMKQHKLERYEYDGREVIFDVTEKIKVCKIKESDE
jgi:hypothetical protein